MATYAIDFGTSNTVISQIDPTTQQPEIVDLAGQSQQLESLPPIIPSLVYVEAVQPKQILIGQTVRDRGLDTVSDSRFFRNFKRGIGTSIQGFLPEIQGQIITFEQVGEWFLTELIARLKAIESLVLTVPVDSFEAYRNWLAGVCQTLDIEQIRLLDEPTAAALGYGIDNGVILVVDFGGGTVDLSLVELDKNASQPKGLILKWGQKLLGDSPQRAKTARVIAKAGQNLGGADIDHWLVDHFAKTQGFVKSALTTRLAERLKIKLSEQTEAEEVYFDDLTLDSYELSLNRGQFEQILQQQSFFNQLDELLKGVLQQASRKGVEAKDIDAVLLVGGSVQIPAVKNWIENYFEPHQIKSDKPFEAISQGALQIAQGLQLSDFLYHSYGIRYWDRQQNRHNWHQIIPSGQAYPMSEPLELFLGASLEQQPSIELIIGEIGTQRSTTEVYFDGDRLVTRSLEGVTTAVQALNDREGARTIARLDPLGFPGSDRLKLLFWVDEQRYLRLTVEDLLTGETLLTRQAVVQLS